MLDLAEGLEAAEGFEGAEREGDFGLVVGVGELVWLFAVELGGHRLVLRYFSTLKVGMVGSGRLTGCSCRGRAFAIERTLGRYGSLVWPNFRATVLPMSSSGYLSMTSCRSSPVESTYDGSSGYVPIHLSQFSRDHTKEGFMNVHLGIRSLLIELEVCSGCLLA